MTKYKKQSKKVRVFCKVIWTIDRCAIEYVCYWVNNCTYYICIYEMLAQILLLQYQNMICFSNNYDFGFDWQLAYSQLLAHYNQLNSDYQKAIDLGRNLQLKIQTITTQNQQIIARKINNSFQTMPNPSESFLPIHTPSQEEITIKPPAKKLKRIKHQSLFEINQPNPYECVYQGCKRVYKSAVSMNLHIKNKHNGGTKKEREEYAKAIIDAELNGEQIPIVPVNFPPNFLDEFRTTYEYMKKYSM